MATDEGRKLRPMDVKSTLLSCCVWCVSAGIWVLGLGLWHIGPDGMGVESLRGLRILVQDGLV